jgi:hypothetical protein
MNLMKGSAMFVGRHVVSGRLSWWLPLLLWGMAVGCAGRQDGVYGGTRTLLASTDDFGTLLLNAGLRAEALPDADPLTPVQVQDGALRAGEYVVGRFYASQEGGFREDTRLPPLPNSTFHHGVVVTVEPR